MRASSASAPTPRSIVNGSVGTRRKRDLLFMRRVFCHERESECVADSPERDEAAAAAERIARRREAAGEGHGHVVAEHRVERELGADRRSQIAPREIAIPRVSRVAEDGSVDAAKKNRPGPKAALN